MDARVRLLELIQLVYAGPGTQEGWQVFLHELCIATNGSAAHFISVSMPSPHATISLTINTDPAALRGYRDHWAAHDPWGHGLARRTIGCGNVVTGDELISHAQLKETAYYRDFSRSYDMVRCVIGTIEPGPDAVSVISINGTERRGPFGRKDKTLLEALVPHIRMALQLHRRLAAAEASADVLGGVIDHASHAVMFVDGCGKVTFMNRAAQTLLAARDGLVAENGELRAMRPADTRQLRRLVSRAAATAAGEQIDSGGAFAVDRPSGRHPLMVLVSPLSRRRSTMPNVEASGVMVVVTDPEHTEIPSAEMLCALLGLTMAEAKLTRLIARGVTLAEAAAQLGIGVQTVRTRTKAIFDKTGTHRQADLVRLVLNGTPRL